MAQLKNQEHGLQYFDRELFQLFDNFGAYYKTIPILGLQKFHILQEQIVYYQDNKLRTYNPVTFDAKMVTLPDTTGTIQAVIDKQRIAILKNDRIDFYKY